MAENNNPKWLWGIISWLFKSWTWLSPIVVGVVASALSPFNNFMRAFAPVSYLVAFLVGAVLTGIVALAVTFAMHTHAKSKYWNRVTAKMPEGVNPLQPSYNDTRVDPRALADPQTNIIRRRTFTRCEIMGAKLTFVITRSIFDPSPGFIGCDFISMPIVQGEAIPFWPNVYVFDNCHFNECKFYFMTVVLPEVEARGLARQGLKGWIIPPPPEPRPPPAAALETLNAADFGRRKRVL